ncbi:MAG: hypothetical protein Q4A07_01800 [Coriobacteriales bacterium]|nr:hypothetical protein [Coriobacteriales bacterium]
MCIKDPSWNRGEMYLAPREALEELLARGACSKLCIYLLLCGDKPGLVNLRISEGTLRDIVSGTDFSRFVVARVPY